MAAEGTVGWRLPGMSVGLMRCTWHQMGSDTRSGAGVRGLPSVAVPAFVRQVHQPLRSPSLEAVERACGALQRRQRVRYTRLDDALRQAIHPSVYNKTAEQIRDTIHEIMETYLLAQQPATCLVMHRKNAAVGQRRSYSSDAKRSRSKDLGGAHAFCPPSPNTSKTPAPPAVRA